MAVWEVSFMRKIAVLIIFLSLLTAGSLVLTQGIFQGTKVKVPVVLSSIIGSRMHKATLAIDGMWCASCAVSAQYSLKSLPSVADAYVGFTKNLDGEGWVVYEPDKVTKEQIVKAIEPYKATITSDIVYTK